MRNFSPAISESFCEQFRIEQNAQPGARGDRHIALGDDWQLINQVAVEALNMSANRLLETTSRHGGIDMNAGEERERSRAVMHGAWDVEPLGQMGKADAFGDSTHPSRINHDVVRRLSDQYFQNIRTAQKHFARGNGKSGLAPEIGQRAQIVHLQHVLQPERFERTKRLGNTQSGRKHEKTMTINHELERISVSFANLFQRSHGPRDEVVGNCHAAVAMRGCVETPGFHRAVARFFQLGHQLDRMMKEIIGILERPWLAWLSLCRRDGINHLIYSGFAINWCLFQAGGGIWEMARHGLLCSAIREVVTAIENKETVRGELAKENALWRVSTGYGFVYELDSFIRAIRAIE